MIVDGVFYTVSMLQVYAACVFLIFILPMMMWRQYLKGKSLTERFLFSAVTQIFFYVNVVLLLGFLNICNRQTLLAAIAAEYILVRWNLSDRKLFQRLREYGKDIQRVFLKQITWRYLLRRYKRNLRESLSQVTTWPIWRQLGAHWFELLLLTGFLVYNALFLTRNVRLYHSYQFSDLPVHLSWVYYLEHGTLFQDGIYPFAMHALIYMIRMLFGLELREIILYFGSFQTLLMIACLFLLCRNVFFRWRWTAYMVLVFFSIMQNQGRYAASLPQECGVFAMVAMAYYLICYLNTPRSRYIVKGDSRLRGMVRINQYLTRRYLDRNFFMLALSVSLVIAFHFYTAIAAVILAVLIVLIYCWRFLRKQYLVPIVAAALLGAFLAILPFGACLAKGIPFQLSMNWAVSVITGEEWTGGTGEGYLESLENQGFSEAGQAIVQQAAAEETETPLFRREGLSAKERLRELLQTVYDFATAYLFGSKVASAAFLIAPLAVVVGLLLLPFRKSQSYGAHYIILVLYVFIMCVLGGAQRLGITVIFDSPRASVFAEPFYCMLLAIPLDLLFFPVAKVRSKRVQCLLAAVSLIICGAVGYQSVQQGLLHNYFDVNLAYYNEPDYLIRRISKEYPHYDYTIVSPTDEYYAVVEHGYHTELSEFVAMLDGKYPAFKFPTKYVFFFIEKYTLQDYFEGQQFVSPEKAKTDFIYQASTQDYYYQRNTIESKAFYWAQAFMEMYPTQMSVYYEDDIYICYILKQEKNSPLDLRIDYITRLEEAQ